MITEAGLVGKIGLNEAGIGVCLNALFTPEGRPGVPIHVVLRGILNSRTLSAAVAAVTAAGTAAAANFLIGDAAGEILDLEALPTGCKPLYPANGVLIHTNHLLQSVAQTDHGLQVLPDSAVRLGRARRLAELRRIGGGKLGMEDVKAILADHLGYPDSICRHPDPERGEMWRLETVCSVLMNLSEKRLWVAFGKPCVTSYVEYEM